MRQRACVTCAWWVPFDASNYEGSSASHKRKLGLCELISRELETTNTEAIGKSKLALVEDGSDYRHNLRTHGEFGCVQWAKTRA